MADRILEIKDGKIVKKSRRLKIIEDRYKRFERLFEALKEYITIIRISGHDVITIRPVPESVLINLPADLQQLYGELLIGPSGGPAPIVHRADCTIIITK